MQSIANLVNNFTEGVDYRIFCSNTDLDNEPMANIYTGKWIKYNEHTQVWYAGRLQRSETLLEEVKKIQPDILYIIGIYNWHFNLMPLLFCKVPQKIVSVRGMLHPGAMSQKAFKKKLYISGWKVLGLQKKTAFHATDDKEKEYIRQVFGKQPVIYTAANFPRSFEPQLKPIKIKGTLKLISIALISPMKNHLLVLQALKTCKAIIEYHIYGPVKDRGYWQLCEAHIEQLPANIKVRYHGNIPPGEVEEKIQQGHIFILPSKSENFGHAIYEALSAGLPVVTSHFTPWLALEKKQAGLNTATDTGALKYAVEFFAAMDNEEYLQWSVAAALYAREALDLYAIKAAYKTMFTAKE